MRLCFLLFILIESAAFSYTLSSGPSSFAPDSFEVGPEVAFLRRIRKGGTRQEGRVEGLYINFDYLKKQTLYFGGLWEQVEGTINGNTGRGHPLRAGINSRTIEGRLGYTLQHSGDGRTFFTPFIGYGYFYETNSFVPPSPLIFTYLNTYQYTCLGVLTGADLNSWLGFWIDFKIRGMLDGKAMIQDDPYNEDQVLKMNNELGFRLDVPLIFSPPLIGFFLKISLTPFYEFRHYGGRDGFPYNYYDTKMNLIGGRASAMLRF